jgi:hypothetical protein
VRGIAQSHSLDEFSDAKTVSSTPSILPRTSEFQTRYRASVEWVMMQQIQQLALAQHDELGDHAGQSKSEDQENEFCQYGSVVVGHEILPASGR